MGNKLIKKKYNKLLLGRDNYYSLGSTLNKAINSDQAGAIGSAVGSVAGSAISGGKSTSVGNALQGLSSVASAIPGPWGAAIGAGLQVAGGLTNAAFGVDWNEENISKVNSNIDQLKGFQSNAGDYDTLMSNWNSAPVGMSFDDDFIGDAGWFSDGKVKKKANQLREQIAKGVAWKDRSLTNNAANIGNEQIAGLLSNLNALGGPLMTNGAIFDTGLTVVGNGGTHEENPYEGVQMGVDSQGIPNKVEQGEVIFNNYVFSKRLVVPKAVRNKYKLRDQKDLSFADAALHASKEAEERPNDPISKAGQNANLHRLMVEQEAVRQEDMAKQNKYAEGGKLGRLYKGTGTIPNFLTTAGSDYMTDEVNLDGTPYNTKRGLTTPTLNDISLDNLVGSYSTINKNYKGNPIENNTFNIKPEPTWMRYIPAYASGAISITDALGLTNKPDYSEANAVLDTAKVSGKFQPVKYNTISNYLEYNPLDSDYYLNQLNATQAASRRALRNSTPNRAQAMSAMLASDYNLGNQIGALGRQAAEYNMANRQKVEEFNRGTNMYNTEGMFKAASANQTAQMNAGQSYFKGALAASELRQKERQISTASRSANLSNFINSLGDIGRENFQRNMIVSDGSNYYYIDNKGMLHYKGAVNSAADGGFLTIRR